MLSWWKKTVLQPRLSKSCGIWRGSREQSRDTSWVEAKARGPHWCEHPALPSSSPRKIKLSGPNHLITHPCADHKTSRKLLITTVELVFHRLQAQVARGKAKQKSVPAQRKGWEKERQQGVELQPWRHQTNFRFKVQGNLPCLGRLGCGVTCGVKRKNLVYVRINT